MAAAARLHSVSAPRAKPRRVFGYARVSSLEQTKGTSLEDQQNAIRAYADALGMAVSGFFVEAESGSGERIESREQMKALLAAIRVGDLVVCHKLDRWSRDPAFSYTSVAKIVETGADFYLLTERCGPRDDNWDTIFGVHALVAKLEHKRIRERMVGTRKLLRDAGFYAEGLPPYGYRRQLGRGERGTSKNVLVIDDKAAEQVRQVFRLCVAGRPLRKIATETGLSKDRVVSILDSRVYLGEVKNSAGEWIPAKHPAIVDADVFARAQAALEARRLGGPRPRETRSETSEWILRDIACCGLCGARMAAAYAGPKGPGRRHYYRCSHGCTRRYVRVGRIEAAAEPLIVARLEELREELARAPERPRVSTRGADLAEKRARLQRKRERYLEAFADGHMTRDELRDRVEKVDAEVLALDGKAAAAKKPSPLADPTARRAMLREVGAIRRAWEGATPEARRRIVGHLAVAVRIALGAAPRFEWRMTDEMAR